MLINLLKIIIPTTLAFFVGLGITPIATHFFYKYKMWKKYSRNENTNPDFKKIHNEKEELKTPRVGGIIIWSSVVFVVFIYYIVSLIFTSPFFTKMDFISRDQTIIPLFTLILASIIGLYDDLIQIYGKGKLAHDDKSWRKWKAFLIALLAFLIAIWFFYKLGMSSINVPFLGEFNLGFLFIPFFILVTLATFSGGVIDGIDGLSGGVLASIFSAYSVIAFINNQINLAVFCGILTGAILAFLWFNVPPARFYMGETGIMGLTVTLTTIAFLTNSVLLLPIIALPLAISSLSVILQIVFKKIRGKGLFILAPIHHHFEAVGWPSYKVTMRFWILSIVFAIMGVILAAIS